MNGDVNPHGDLIGHPQPGETCPTCDRRVNHPKKETTPESKPTPIGRMPLDEAESFESRLDDFARRTSFYKRPYYKYRTVELCLDICAGFTDEQINALSAGDDESFAASYFGSDAAF
jgi:hypothetical protein